MECTYCHQKIDWIQRQNAPDLLVHTITGDHHCNADWEVRGGHVATPMEVTAK
jgi:hypothetical protein